MKFQKIIQTDSFQKDLKKLLKKYHTLNEDLESLINSQLILLHKFKIDNHGIYPIEGLGFENPKCYVVKNFACKALKGKGMRSGHSTNLCLLS